MRTLFTVPLAFFLITQPAFCGPGGYMPLSATLGKADTVVVATVRSAITAGNTLTLDLIVIRVLKGPTTMGSSIQATLSSGNVSTSSGGGLRMNGEVSANAALGKTGLWFLEQTGSAWTIIPLANGDISTEDIYLPVPPGRLPSSVTYDATADPKKKLVQEIAVAAQDPMTAVAISRLEAMRVFVDLGSDELQPVFIQLASSPQMATRAMALAGQIRLGTPSALNTVVSSNLEAFSADAQSQLTAAVCEYRNTDVSGLAALGALLGSQYSDKMRDCAVHALREIHSRETLPFLEKLLEDNSPQIRYDAVIGIAQFAIGFPVARMEDKKAAISGFTPGPNFTSDMYPHYPAQGLFLSNEQEYISYWKNWLAAHPTQ